MGHIYLPYRKYAFNLRLNIVTAIGELTPIVKVDFGTSLIDLLMSRYFAKKNQIKKIPSPLL